VIDLGPVQRAGGMELWFHLRQLPKLEQLHRRRQIPMGRYIWLLQQEQERLTGLTLALAELVDALGDAIAEAQAEGMN
jgi:hypothetical protein